MEFADVVARRRMVRRYRPDPVDADTVRRIVATALQAPSAGFSQPHRFVVVTSADRRGAIAEACEEEAAVARGLPRWVSVAPVHVIPCVDRGAYRRRYAEADKRASTGPDRWEVPFDWVDAGAAFMLLLLASVAEGLAAGFLAVPAARLRDAAAIPDAWTPVGLITIGHPAEDDPPGSGRRRGRLPVAEVVIDDLDPPLG